MATQVDIFLLAERSLSLGKARAKGKQRDESIANRLWEVCYQVLWWLIRATSH